MPGAVGSSSKPSHRAAYGITHNPYHAATLTTREGDALVRLALLVEFTESQGNARHASGRRTMRKQELSSKLAWHREDLRNAGPGWYKVPVYRYRAWQPAREGGLVDFRKARLADLNDWSRTKPKPRLPQRPRSSRIEGKKQLRLKQDVA